MDSSPFLFHPQCLLPCDAKTLWTSWLSNMGIFQKKTKPNLPLVKKKGLFLLLCFQLILFFYLRIQVAFLPGTEKKKNLYLKMAHLPWEHGINAPQLCLLFIKKYGSWFQLIPWGRKALQTCWLSFWVCLIAHFHISSWHSTSLLLPVTSCLFIIIMTPPPWLKIGRVMWSPAFALLYLSGSSLPKLWRESPQVCHFLLWDVQ